MSHLWEARKLQEGINVHGGERPRQRSRMVPLFDPLLHIALQARTLHVEV